MDADQERLNNKAFSWGRDPRGTIFVIGLDQISSALISV
jgi:hypothetical protein